MTRNNVSRTGAVALTAVAVAVLAAACCVCPDPMYATAYYEPAGAVSWDVRYPTKMRFFIKCQRWASTLSSS